LGLQELTTRLIYWWANVVLWFFGIRRIASGEENLPASGGGIIVFNHQSHFDIPVMVSTTRKHIRFGAKIELFKIPLFGRAMRAVGTLPIARENRKEVLKTYSEASRRFEKDFLFVLAPEGTRQKEPVIGRFKKGPFLFAINAGVPIIPVVIRGAHSVMSKDSLNINLGRLRRTVYLQYLPAVSTKGYALDKIDEIVKTVQDSMRIAYASLPPGD